MINRVRPFVDWAVRFRINGRRFPLYVRKMPLVMASFLVWLIVFMGQNRR